MLPPQALAFLQPHRFPRRPFPPALPSTTTNPLVGSVCRPRPPPHVSLSLAFPVSRLVLSSQGMYSLFVFCYPCSLSFAPPHPPPRPCFVCNHIACPVARSQSHPRSLSFAPHPHLTLSLSPSPSAPPLIRLPPHLSSQCQHYPLHLTSSVVARAVQLSLPVLRPLVPMHTTYSSSV